MRGRRTRDSAGAVSRSSGARGGDGVGGIEVLEGGSRAVLTLDPLDPPDPRDPSDRLDSLAESTAAICARSDARALAAGASSRRDARWKRTPAPRSVTAEKKQSALRSDGVTRERCASAAWRRHPDVARRIVEFRLKAYGECKRLIVTARFPNISTTLLDARLTVC